MLSGFYPLQLSKFTLLYQAILFLVLQIKKAIFPIDVTFLIIQIHLGILLHGNNEFTTGKSRI